ncbi:MAG TPA: hypothetical protein VLI92_02625 [Candidatus Saccharimonadales bacterium]|nr:hypothetical protein [Candidatus Saccharimonadales bacterium]
MLDTLIVFTYAHTGLGHLRVTDALVEGLPSEQKYIIFEVPESSSEFLHRFSSLHIVARYFLEWLQRGLPEKIFTRVYRNYLKKHAGKLLMQFTSVIKAQNSQFEKIIIVSTHFTLAHQLGAIKKQIEVELKTEVNLVVQVTDDSPQYLWYVDTADTIVVPSHETKTELQKYAQNERLTAVKIEVASYPIVPSFSKPLNNEQISDRQNQYDPTKDNKINIAIPISGAAVGTQFFLHLMEKLHSKSERFVFYVVCRQAPFTESFIKEISKRSYIKLFVSESYKEVVELYDHVYLNQVISAEVTKPSEQAFKALIHNNSVGGAFLFFAQPVGRQEYDNLDFLKNHGFLSDTSRHQRALLLPIGSDSSVKIIWEKFSSGVLLDVFNKFQPAEKSDETSDMGVRDFWKLILKI